LVALNITVLSYAQLWYALAPKNSNIVTVKQKLKMTYCIEKSSKKSIKIRIIFISEMKTTFFYTITFLAFLLANPSVAMSKFISSVNYCSIDSMARFLNRKVLN